jgi:hypothetical protein
MKGFATRPPTRTPATGEPNSTQKVPGTAPGEVTERTYGPDGRALKDVDNGHSHDPEVHAHDWDWTKDPARQPRRDLTPEEASTTSFSTSIKDFAHNHPVMTAVGVGLAIVGVGAAIVLTGGTAGGLLAAAAAFWRNSKNPLVEGIIGSLILTVSANVPRSFFRLVSCACILAWSMRSQTMESTIQRFNAIRWHDSKLLGLSFYRADSEDRVRISVQLLGERDVFTRANIVFKGSTYIVLDVDLDGKRVCADDISGAECYASSQLIRSLSERNPRDSFEGYLHFEIYLIPPGGKINILAKDFVVEPSASAD